MGQRLSWNWSLFWWVFAATAYFHLSAEVAFLLLVFMSLFGLLGDWAWLAYLLWVLNLYPATRAAQWAQTYSRQIASWHRSKHAKHSGHPGHRHAADP